MWKRQVMGEGRMRKRREMGGNDVRVPVLAQEAGKAGTRAQARPQAASQATVTLWPPSLSHFEDF